MTPRDLTDTVQPGTYTLTVGLAARSDEPDARVTDGMFFRLFYRDTPSDPNNNPLVDRTVAWTELSNTTFTDFTASVVVPSGASFLGKTLGILLYDGEVNTNLVDVSVDNFRLDFTPAPEPSSVALAVSAVVGLLAYAWRKRR